MLKVIPLSSLIKVFSDEEPVAKPFEKLSCLSNEKVQLQVAFCSDTDCDIDVNVDCKFNGDINVYWVEEIYSKNPVHVMQDDYTLRKKSGYFPELLRPLKGAFKAKANKWNSIWLEIEPNSTKDAGEHKIVVTLASVEDKQKMEFVLDVIGAELPPQTLINTNWFHTDCIATHYNIEVFSEKYWGYVKNFLEVAVEHGMNMVLTPLFTPPLDTKVGGERPTVQLVDVKVVNDEYVFDFVRTN